MNAYNGEKKHELEQIYRKLKAKETSAYRERKHNATNNT